MASTPNDHVSAGPNRRVRRCRWRPLGWQRSPRIGFGIVPAACVEADPPRCATAGRVNAAEDNHLLAGPNRSRFNPGAGSIGTRNWGPVIGLGIVTAAVAASAIVESPTSPNQHFFAGPDCGELRADRRRGVRTD